MLPGRSPPSGTPAATATVDMAAAAVNLRGRPLGLVATSASHDSNNHGRHGGRATLGRHATLRDMIPIREITLSCHRFLTHEQSKKSDTNGFLGKPGTHREWIHTFLSFFA